MNESPVLAQAQGRVRAGAVSRPSFAVCSTLLLVCACLLLAGCSSRNANRPELKPLPYDMPVDPPPGVDILSANTYAGDALASMLLQRTGDASAILVTSLVRLETLDDNTNFGRLSAQQIGSRIAQHGFMIVDVRLTQSMVINQKGEFMLSRDLGKLLARDYNAHAVIGGTYTYSANKIFVSVRAIRLTDNAVIAAYEYFLPLSGDTAYLLGGQGSGAASADNSVRRYSARGQAFPNCPTGESAVSAPVANQPMSAGASESRAPTPGQGTSSSLGREYVAPANPRAGTGLPEQVDVMSGGKRVPPK